MTVTAIRKLSSERFAVTIGDREIKTTANVLSQFRLFEGRELEPDLFEEFTAESARALAREHALEILSRQQMSEKEMRRKLMEKGYDAVTAAYCSDWLAERHYLNDAEYAGMLVRHYSSKGYGTGRIRSEFIRRGISRDLWDEALNEMPGGNERLSDILQKKLKGDYSKDNIRKASSSLFRRGFSWDEIRSALNELDIGSD